MSSNVDKILNLINKTVIENYSVNVWVPSVSNLNVQHISFKPLSISQQKDLLNTAIGQDIYNGEFTKTVFNILRQNYLSENILPLNYLNIIDKIIILLSLRSNINSSYKNISLNDIIKKIQSYNMSSFTPQMFESDNIKIYCNLPTIYGEYVCEQEREINESDSINEQIQHVVSETITNELTKFCAAVHIDEVSILEDSFSFSERKQIISQLPAFLLEKVLNYIIGCRKQIEDMLTIDGQEKETIQLNGVFFSTN